jgi:hypothetical protein
MIIESGSIICDYAFISHKDLASKYIEKDRHSLIKPNFRSKYSYVPRKILKNRHRSSIHNPGCGNLKGRDRKKPPEKDHQSVIENENPAPYLP